MATSDTWNNSTRCDLPVSPNQLYSLHQFGLHIIPIQTLLMNKLYNFIFIILALPCMGQDAEDWTKDLQDAHVRINGTRASMVLDQPGWVQSPTNPKLILNEELQAYLFIEQKKLTVEEYEMDWMPILIGEDKPDLITSIRFQDYRGKLIKSKAQTPRGDQVLWLAYIGNDKNVLDIKGAYPLEQANQAEQQTLAMLRSLYIDDQIIIRMFETMPFTADVERHGFTEEESYMVNSVLLTNPQTRQTIQILLMDQFDSSREEIIGQEINRLNDMDIQVDLDESEFNGRYTDLLIYQSPSYDGEEWTYTALIFQDNQYFNVTMIMAESPENRHLFKEIVESVQLKEERKK